MSLEQAHQSLNQRNYTHAEAHFRAAVGDNPLAARRGLTRVLAATDRLDEARDVIELNLNSGSAEDVALYGDVIGKLGNRAASEALLRRFVQKSPHPYVLAVLGEQQVRQGDWGPGTTTIKNAIRQSPDGLAGDHVRGVVSELSVAMSSGRLPPDLAIKFVDRLINDVPRESTLFEDLRAARSAMGRSEAWRPGGSTPPPTPTPTSQPPQQTQAPPPMPQRNSVPLSTRIPKLVQIMKRDRELNESLQQGVAAPGLPAWPSSKTKLDPIPILSPKLLGFKESELRAATARLTEGSIANEIMIERAKDALLTEATRHTSLPLVYGLQAINRLEVMVWDGILDRLKPLADVYQQDDKIDYDMQMIALAGFLGSLIEKSFRGVWEFGRPITNSVVYIEKRSVNPFKWAQQWLADFGETVDLLMLWDQAEEAAIVTHITNTHVDETQGLADASLRLRLAEFWLEYVGRPSIHIRDAAETIQILQETPGAIAFAIDKKFAPTHATGKHGFGLIHNLVTVGYARANGDFYCLGISNHMARYLNATVPVASPQAAQAVVKILDALHCPGISLQNDGDEPTVEQKPGGGYVIRLSATRGQTDFRWILEYRPGYKRPWVIEMSAS